MSTEGCGRQVALYSADSRVVEICTFLNFFFSNNVIWFLLSAVCTAACQGFRSGLQIREHSNRASAQLLVFGRPVGVAALP